MNMRSIGHSTLQVAPLALGGNVFGWTIDDKQSFAVLSHFVDAGFNLIDTANVYSRWKAGHVGGESETIIGKWMKAANARSKVVIATKVGMDMGEGGKGLSRAHIMKSVEDSLKRLQTDHIDLYQSHTDDADTPQEETLEAYSQLIAQGKVRFIGASNFKAERIATAHALCVKNGWPAYQCLQPCYNLYEREDFESKLLPICLEEGIGVIPYFSLARGFLSGKYRSEADLSQSARGAGIKKYLDERGFRILAVLDAISTAKQTSRASVALAWLMAQPGITAPIASATSREQLDELISSASLNLTSAEIEQLNQASAF